MHVGVETRELLVELAHELQILDDGAVEALAGNQQRNARRVRRDQHGGNATFQLVHRHPIDLAVRQALVGIRRLHHRHHVRQVHVGGHPRHVVPAIGIMHAGGQIAQAHAVVHRVGLHEIRHHPPQRLVLVVVGLELLQLGHQRVPAPLRDADGEHHEERIEPGLLHHHAMLGQILGDDRRRDAGVGKLALHVQSRSDDGGLDRVQHVEAGLDGAEAVPLLVGVQHPFFLAQRLATAEVVRPPDPEPPRTVVFLLDLAHGPAEVTRFLQRLLHQRRAARCLHHRCRHVARSDDGVLRRRGRVHQVAFVETVAVQLAGLRLLHQDL